MKKKRFLIGLKPMQYLEEVLRHNKNFLTLAKCLGRKNIHAFCLELDKKVLTIYKNKGRISSIERSRVKYL